MQGAQMSDIRVGSIVTSKCRNSGSDGRAQEGAIMDYDEGGVCYAVDGRGGDPIYRFVFARGGREAFSADDCGVFLHDTGERHPALADYRYRNDEQVSADHAAGMFEPAFARALCLGARPVDRLDISPGFGEAELRHFLEEAISPEQLPLPEDLQGFIDSHPGLRDFVNEEFEADAPKPDAESEPDEGPDIGP